MHRITFKKIGREIVNLKLTICLQRTSKQCIILLRIVRLLLNQLIKVLAEGYKQLNDSSKEKFLVDFTEESNQIFKRLCNKKVIT